MRASARQRGFTVIEIAISMVACVVIAMGVQGVVKASDGLQRRTHAQSSASSTDRRALERIADLLRSGDTASMTGLTLNTASLSVSFQNVTSYAVGVRTLGTAATLQWEATGAVTGVSEPGRVVLVQGGTTSVIAPRVARNGFTVTDIGTGIKVHLETFTVMTNGEISRESADTFVSLRN